MAHGLVEDGNILRTNEECDQIPFLHKVEDTTLTYENSKREKRVRKL